MKKILSFGEIVWDIFEDGKVLGGAPLNFAYYCSKLGTKSKIISAVGRDANGMGALETIISHNMSTDLVSTNSHPTGEVLVSIDEQHSAKYDIVKNCAWDFIEYQERAAREIADADVFAFGTLAQRSQMSRDTLARLVEKCPPNCLKVIDVNLRLKFYTKEIIDFSLTHADIVKMNEAELNKICNMYGYNGDTLMRAKFIFEAFDLKYLILTRGEDGYTVFEKGGMFIGQAKKVKIVDTVGAGDSFFATFMASIINGEDPELAAEKGAEIAAQVCSRRGAFCL